MSKSQRDTKKEDDHVESDLRTGWRTNPKNVSFLHYPYPKVHLKGLDYLNSEKRAERAEYLKDEAEYFSFARDIIEAVRAVWPELGFGKGFTIWDLNHEIVKMGRPENQIKSFNNMAEAMQIIEKWMKYSGSEEMQTDIVPYAARPSEWWMTKEEFNSKNV